MMASRDVAVLSFKLVGLWLMAKAAIGVAGIPYYWAPEFEGARFAAVMGTILPLLVALGIGVPLWFSADWFAARALPGPSAELARAEESRPESLLALALSIIGVFLMCQALPALVNAVGLLIQSGRLHPGGLGAEAFPSTQGHLWSTTAKANAAAAVARFIIAAALLLGPARLSAALSRLSRGIRGPLPEDGQGV
jgi:hypothetical protein